MHNVDNSTGEAAMAYVGETPWHGLGKQLLPDQPIEEWVKAAQLAWKIEKQAVQYSFNGQLKYIPERIVLMRNDTGDALSIVGSDYQVVQPSEVLEFYRDLVDEHGYTLETAGALDGGRKVWALARTEQKHQVAGSKDDEIALYVLLATSCDKSLATTATFTSVRVVCQNTLAFAFEDMKFNNRKSIKVDHTKKFDPTEIKIKLALIDRAWVEFKRKINEMAACKIDEIQSQTYFENLFLSEKEQVGQRYLTTAKANEVSLLIGLCKSAQGQNLESAKGTLWGAVNAVTNYIDHARKIKSGERIDNAWFGTGATFKEKAWEQAIALLKEKSTTR